MDAVTQRALDQLRPGHFQLGPASCQLSVADRVPGKLQPATRYLSDLAVEPEARGQGYARALLEQMIDLADRNGIVLMLEVRADADSPLDDAALANWYGRLGFVTMRRPVGGQTRLMARLALGLVPEHVDYDPMTGEAVGFTHADPATATPVGLVDAAVNAHQRMH